MVAQKKSMNAKTVKVVHTKRNAVHEPKGIEQSV